MQYHAVNHDKQGLDLATILRSLGQLGFHDLWLEAGAKSFNTFLNAKLLNRVYLYLSLKTLGAAAMPAFVNESNILQMAKQIRWQQMGLDVMVEMQRFPLTSRDGGV